TTNAEAAGIVPAPGALNGSGDAIALDPAQNNAFRFINRALAAGGTLHFIPASGGSSARYIVTGVAPAQAQAWIKDLYIQAERTDASSASSGVSSTVPTRIALYKSAP